MEMLEDLESLFSWLIQHIEIQSVLLIGSGNKLGNGLSPEDLIKMEFSQLQKLTQKLHRLIYSMFFLPQTIVTHLKDGAKGLHAELSLGADIRICHKDATVHFNQLSEGMIPASGGIGFLSALISPAQAKSWHLIKDHIPTNELHQSGFIHRFEKFEESIYIPLLEKISKQSPVARIQCKRSLLETIIGQLDRSIERDSQFAFAGMSTNDWKKWALSQHHKTQPEYTKAKDWSRKLKTEKELELLKLNKGPNLV